MEHIINALRDIELKLVQTKDIDAAIEWEIKKHLCDMIHDAKYIERLIKDNGIEGII